LWSGRRLVSADGLPRVLAVNHLAPSTSPAVEGVTGRFFVDRAPVETAPHTTHAGRYERLWNDSARLVGLFP